MAWDAEELEAWRAAAERKLEWQAARARKYAAYYDGEEAIPAILSTDERRAFRDYLAQSAANWAELVVNAVAERLTVTGFRFGASSDRAWLIWQANGFDADSEMVQTDALITGQAPILVQPADNAVGVSVTAESPQQAAVLYQPGNRRDRVAGYKRWRDEYGEQQDHWRTTEVLILPDVIATWEPDDYDPAGIRRAPRTEPNPGAAIVEIVPHPRTLGAPRSELKSVLPIQDRINTTLYSRLVSVDYGAFRQIWAAGVRMRREILTDQDGKAQPELDPGTGQPTGRPRTRQVKPFDVGANRLLISEDPAARFGFIPEATLAGVLAAVEQDVQQLAAITQTPPHYLLGTLINLSGDAITAAEAGLVAKVRRRARHIAGGYLDVQRAALTLVGDAAAAEPGAEVIWADFETRSVAQLTDSLVKMSSLGVPEEELWRRYGATETEIRRWRQQSTAAAANAAATTAAALGATDAYAAALAAGGQAGGGG